jgi:DNA repair protein RecN (Recombination protein N)
MIEFLKITSMAIFDELEIEFTPGLNCITGETGAGKSLVLDALTLLMGARAGRELIRPHSDKTIIEALFSASGREIALRRELYPSGSNRCFIDGKLVTATNLAEASSDLIHIYGQHEYQDLLSPKQHMRILEDLYGISRDEVNEAYKEYTDARAYLLALVNQIETFQKEREYLEFSLQDLKSMPLEEGLEETLSLELDTGRAAEELKTSALAVQEIIYSGTPSITDLASEARQHIGRLVSHDPGMEALLISMDNLIVQIEDIHLVLRERMSAYEHDPERIEAFEEQINTLRELKRKHHMDEKGLIKLRNDLQVKFSLLDDSSQSTAMARSKVEESLREYQNALKKFLIKRKEFGAGLCRRVNRDLKDLGMATTNFTLYQQDVEKLNEALMDTDGSAISPNNILKGEFLISTNIGHSLLPLAKIASGGELSRIMLAIKVQQKAMAEATMVFDEIDSGISGQTAIAIAAKLKDLSDHAQSIVVTHLHQVASVADSHFVITKTVSGKTTSSTLKKVGSMDRVMELARMMGGDSPSMSVIEHAKELVLSHGKQIPGKS